MKIIQEANYKGFPIFVKIIGENTTRPHLCGYVEIDQSNENYNKSTWQLQQIDCHDGITFAGDLGDTGKYCIGFACVRYGDNIKTQNEEYVLRECIYIVEQILKTPKEEARKIADTISIIKLFLGFYNLHEINHEIKIFRKGHKMKTKEFIKNLEKLNLNVQEHQDTILIRRNVGGYWIAYISKTKMFTFNAAFQDFGELYTETKSKLLELIVAYVKTPIKNREVSKKYHLKLKAAKHFGSPSNFYLNKTDYEYMLSDCQQSSIYKTEFTQEEIDNLPSELIAIFEKVEVEDEN